MRYFDEIGPQHIFITGVPGSGKTTKAYELSKENKLPILSLDSLSAKNGHKFPGTEEAKEAIQQLTKSHIIEGVQLMGIPKKYFKKNELILLNPDKEEVLNRLMARGWHNSAGTLFKGKSSKKEATDLYNKFSERYNSFLVRYSKEK